MASTTNQEPPSLRLVQFPHPGFEYSPAERVRYSLIPGARKSDGTGLMGWKDEGSPHNRKYLRARGAVMRGPDGPIEVDVTLGFWGEWEPPSRWVRIEGPIAPGHPSVIHDPLLPGLRPKGRHQNTDPLVFGDAFHYTNCRIHLRPMQGLEPGSIILFGRSGNVGGERKFALDACLVIDERQPEVSVGEGREVAYGEDLITDLVLYPLRSDSANDRAAFSLDPWSHSVLDPCV